MVKVARLLCFTLFFVRIVDSTSLCVYWNIEVFTVRSYFGLYMYVCSHIFQLCPPIAPPLTKSTYCCFWFCHVLPSRVRKTRGNTDFIVLGTKRAISDQSFFLKFILVIIFTKFHFFAATQQLHINFTLKNPLLPFLILNSYCLMFRFVLH